MSYLAFALKYRPKNFNEVVGQKHIVTALTQAILKKHVHHAYLFSGPRGVGKTSLARIFAKSLNCFEGPTITPCEKCLSCTEISRGTNVDIIEIDGASNRGIDEIRTLKENVRLACSYSRYRIYVIDEVHMLTQEAFNALLKTLEEPPQHIKFIFATTHPQKVLPTILSRCQKFSFNLLDLETIVGKLKKIRHAEKINIEDTLLYALAKLAGGSIRDAESLLDQLAPVIMEQKSVDDVISFLGIVDEEILNEVLKLLVEKNLPESLEFIDKIVGDGKDLGVFINNLIEHLRNLLLAKVSIKSFNESIISPYSKDFLLQIAKCISNQDILKMIDLLIWAKDLSHNLNTVRIPLELAFIKFLMYEQDVIKSNKEDSGNTSTRVQSKELLIDTREVKYSDKGDFTGNPAKSGIPLQRENHNDKPAREEVLDNKSSAISAEFDKEEIVLDDVLKESISLIDDVSIEENDVKAEDDNVLLYNVKEKWDDILSQMKKVRAAIASHLGRSRAISSSGDILKIAFDKKDYFHKEIVETNKNLKFIEESFSKFLGKEIKIKFVSIDKHQVQTEAKKETMDAVNADGIIEEKKTSNNDTKRNDFIDEILDTFGGDLYTK